MNEELKKIIPLAFNGQLNQEKTSEAFEIIMSGHATDGQIGAFLMALQKSGITSQHVLGAISVMQNKMIKVKIPSNSIDTCGTGGDGKSTLNVSTAMAFVIAAHNIPVAKHGNKALTSKCGSADVLNSLGININMHTDLLESCLKKIGICFMFAPNHHPAMRYVGPVRQQIGVRTIFNMLGPLLNPGGVNKQIIGVFSKDVLKIYKDIFGQTSGKNTFIIYGFDGMDEISTEGSNLIFSNKFGESNFDPKDLKISRPNVNELKGQNPEYNANRIREIFTGKKDSFYDLVCINSAFAFLLDAVKEPNQKNIMEYYELSKTIIDNGLAEKKLNDLVSFSNS